MHLGDPEIDFVKLARSQGVDGVRVTRSSDLIPALQQGIRETGRGNPFLIDVVVRTVGGGAGSTWHGSFQVARTPGHAQVAPSDLPPGRGLGPPGSHG
jgi:TPP-dependent trihydroxycyclohexane-1,2-dione (THcHDO) dehydratase